MPAADGHKWLPPRHRHSVDDLAASSRVEKVVRKSSDGVFSIAYGDVQGGHAAAADRRAAGCRGSCQSMANQASVAPVSNSRAYSTPQLATVIWHLQYQLSMSDPISGESRLQQESSQHRRQSCNSRRLVLATSCRECCRRPRDVQPTENVA